MPKTETTTTREAAPPVAPAKPAESPETLELRGQLAKALAEAESLRGQLKAKDKELFAADDARARIADALVNARLVQGVNQFQARTAWPALVHQVRSGLAKVPRGE